MIFKAVLAGIILLGLGIIGLVFAASQLVVIEEYKTQLVEKGDSFLGRLGRALVPSIDDQFQQNTQQIVVAETQMKMVQLVSGIASAFGFVLIISGFVIKPLKNRNKSGKVFCRYCGKLRPVSGTNCSECGKPTMSSVTETKMCSFCAATMSADSEFCANCRRKFQGLT